MARPAGFEIRDVGVQQIPAGGKRTVKVLASVQRTGMFTVKGQATTPDGGALGNETTLSVRSTAYGGLALGIPLSRWFLITSGFGALFMVAAKRYSELVLMSRQDGEVGASRALLGEYTIGYLRFV